MYSIAVSDAPCPRLFGARLYILPDLFQSVPPALQTARTIKQQFLMESIVIGQLGGILGIILGVLAGNITALAIKIPFVLPWLWIVVGITVCFFVGVASGYIPAVRASRLDPIEALRYE